MSELLNEESISQKHEQFDSEYICVVSSVPDFFPETGCDDGVPSSRSVFPLHHHFLHFPLQGMSTHAMNSVCFFVKKIFSLKGKAVIPHCGGYCSLSFLLATCFVSAPDPLMGF